VSRVPIRLRLALGFALAMAIVLAAVGSLLYVRLGDSLLEQTDENLEALAEGVESPPDPSRPGIELTRFLGEEGFVQLLVGSEVRTFPSFGGRLVDAGEERRASGGAYLLTRESSPMLEGGAARMHVSSVEIDGEEATLVVGSSLEDREEALDGLLAQLLVVGPLALLLTTVGGYFLAGAALRPVDAMRRRAVEISGDRTDQRLPLPRANDEIRHLGETLNDMLGRLEAGLARERRFVADASHELRTPLTSLRTELELALRRPRSQAELEEALRSATEEVERVVRLAEDLLVLARADDGRLPLSRSNHFVRELLDAVAGRYDSQAALVGRSIEVSAPADWICTGDRLRLEQALGNLVDNALRHGKGAIRLEAIAEDGSIAFRVSDEGTGFPPDFLPYAFERFSRADVARSEAGAGLGLAIVDAVARAHGGSAGAENLPGGGAAITIRVPATTWTEPHLALI
jgi:two-component system OmpR family sensor kinase